MSDWAKSTKIIKDHRFQCNSSTQVSQRKRVTKNCHSVLKNNASTRPSSVVLWIGKCNSTRITAESILRSFKRSSNTSKETTNYSKAVNPTFNPSKAISLILSSVWGNSSSKSLRISRTWDLKPKSTSSQSFFHSDKKCLIKECGDLSLQKR